MKTLIKTSSGVELQNTELTKNFANSNTCKKGILLKVDMVGLCRTDLLVAAGKIPAKKENIVLGHEFSATIKEDETGTYLPGTKVGFNPLWGGEFMGLDFDGALREYMWVSENQLDKIIPTNSTNDKLIAYLEPVAASMAVLKPLEALHLTTQEKSALRLAVVGNNRIATLTHTILTSMGWPAELVSEKSDFIPNHYDYLIETVFEEEVLTRMLASLKEGGTLIVKSRKKFPVALIASDLVARELTLKAVNYYDFHKAMRWLENNESAVAHLLGDSYSLEDWAAAFEVAQSGEQKKIFVQVSAEEV